MAFFEVPGVKDVVPRENRIQFDDQNFTTFFTASKKTSHLPKGLFRVNNTRTFTMVNYCRRKGFLLFFMSKAPDPPCSQKVWRKITLVRNVRTTQ